MADEPELQKNQSGEWVQYLQQLLQNASYWSGEANGEFDDQLEWAVMQFQGAYGISADGVVRQDTWDALTGNSSGGESGEEEQVYIDADLAELNLIIQANCDPEEYLRLMGIDPAVLAEAEANS